MQRSAITVLTDEHDGLQRLFARVSEPDEDRRAVLKELLQSLSVHVTMEKQLLVPVVKDRVDGGEKLAGHVSDYHDEVGKILTLLERRKANSGDVPDLVTDLLELTDSHIAEAEETLLPALGHALSSEELTDLGVAMVSDERQLLTHSHPHLPDTGVTGKVSRWAASLVDRVRDNSPDIGRSST